MKTYTIEQTFATGLKATFKIKARSKDAACAQLSRELYLILNGLPFEKMKGPQIALKVVHTELTTLPAGSINKIIKRSTSI